MKNNVLNNHHDVTVKFVKWHHLFSAILVAVTNLISVLLVHELEPKKIGLWLQRVDKTYYGVLVTSGIVKSMMSCPNW